MNLNYLITMMEKFDLLVSKIVNFAGTDGILHSYVCTILTILFCSLFNFFGLILVALVAVGKEVIDFFTKNEFSKKDLVCDGIGTAIGLILILLA